MSKKCEGIIRFKDLNKVEGYQETSIFVTSYCLIRLYIFYSYLLTN